MPIMRIYRYTIKARLHFSVAKIAIQLLLLPVTHQVVG